MDLELPEGVGFVEAWDAWMAAKMDATTEPEPEPSHGHGQPEQVRVHRRQSTRASSRAPWHRSASSPLTVHRS